MIDRGRWIAAMGKVEVPALLVSKMFIARVKYHSQSTYSTLDTGGEDLPTPTGRCLATP